MIGYDYAVRNFCGVQLLWTAFSFSEVCSYSDLKGVETVCSDQGRWIILIIWLDNSTLITCHVDGLIVWVHDLKMFKNICEILTDIKRYVSCSKAKLFEEGERKLLFLSRKEELCMISTLKRLSSNPSDTSSFFFFFKL